MSLLLIEQLNRSCKGDCYAPSENECHSYEILFKSRDLPDASHFTNATHYAQRRDFLSNIR